MKDYIWLCAIIAVMLLIGIGLQRAAATPTGPLISYLGNSTSLLSGTATVENNATIRGGIIATLLLNVRQQDSHWKAYVGNVTGTYILEDASNYSIYEWGITSIAGEVYATRTSGSINWNQVLCANSTHVYSEMTKLLHNATNTPGDSLNDTFDDNANNHWAFYAGGSSIGANTCGFSINPWVNDTTQTSTNYFEEVLLYDNSSSVIYASRIEQDLIGYHTNATFDFQMLVAENASPAAPATSYYFYVELS